MKSKFTFYIIALCNVFCWTGCISDPDLPDDIINAKAPEVQTIKLEGKTATTITISAEVLKENGTPVTEYGVYWNKGTAIDTTKAESLSAGKGKGVFSVTIEGLDNDSEYAVAPYAKNKKGIGLGETEIVNTNTGVGTVTTLDAQKITATTADLGGKIGIPGEGLILERGVYMASKPNAEKPDTIIKSEMDTDSFVCHVTGLDPNIEYYVKAFVKNSFGVFVGSEKKFKTPDGLPKMGDFTTVEIGFYDATFSAEVKDEGDSPVTERGFCYNIEERDTELPTIENHTLLCGEGGGTFEGKIEDLSNLVQYRIRAYAKNKFGVSYSEKDTIFSVKSDFPLVRIDAVNIGKGFAEVNAIVLDEGESAVIESGICWSATNTMPDSTDNVMPLSSGKKQFSGVIESLRGSTTYYVRAYAKNSTKTAYSEKATTFKTHDLYRELKPLNEERTQGSTSFFYTKDAGYLLGGLKNTYSNELWRFSYAQGNWDPVSAYPETGIFGQSPVTIDRSVYVFGGKTASDAYIDGFYKYDTYNNTWTAIDTEDSPDPIAFAAGCNIGQSAYYIGGMRADTVCGEISQYNSQDDKWSLKSTTFPEAQSGGIALVHDNDAIYAGLGVTDKDRTQNNKGLWVSNDFGVTWSSRSSIPHEASKIIGGVVYEDDIYVVDNNGQIWKYSPEEDKWYEKTLLTVLNKEIHCIYLLHDEIYIGLGSGTSHFIAYRPYWDN